MNEIMRPGLGMGIIAVTLHTFKIDQFFTPYNLLANIGCKASSFLPMSNPAEAKYICSIFLDKLSKVPGDPLKIWIISIACHLVYNRIQPIFEHRFVRRYPFNIAIIMSPVLLVAAVNGLVYNNPIKTSEKILEYSVLFFHASTITFLYRNAFSITGWIVRWVISEPDLI